MHDIDILRSFGVLHRTFLAYFSRALSTRGVSYSEGSLLANIAVMPGCTQEALSQELVIDKGAVARSVKKLRQAGLVRVERSPVHHRAHALWLTAEGEALFAQIQAWNTAWLGHVTEDLDDDERAQFYSVLRRLKARAVSVPEDITPPAEPR